MRELHRSITGYRKDGGRGRAKLPKGSIFSWKSAGSHAYSFCIIMGLVLFFLFTGALIGAPQTLSSVDSTSAVTDYAKEFFSLSSFSDGSFAPVRVKFTRKSRRSITSFEPEEIDADIKTPDQELPLSAVDSSETLGPDEAFLQESLSQLYHSPHVFSLNYEEMMQKLQISVYSSPSDNKYVEHKHDGGSEVNKELSSTADFFFRSLARSKFLTRDPEQAQLFLLPVSIDALWIEVGPEKVAAELRRYVQKVRDDHPYWDRSLGADHFYLSCHAYPHVNHRNFLELSKNAIQVACSPLRKNQHFFPHKDIVFPDYRPDNPKGTSDFPPKAAQRTKLAYFSCPPEGDPTLASSIPEEWTSDPDFLVESDSTADSWSIQNKVAASKFCVIASSHDTSSIIDYLRLGCVPVFISKFDLHDLAFQDILNWHAFSVVFAGATDISHLKDVLTDIPDTTYRRMQYLGHQAIKHLEWNTPPVAYDAFHLTLYELWVRRHSIKYASRNRA